MKNAVRQTKDFVKDQLPSLWLRWHLMHRPKTAEVEIGFLDRIVSPDDVTVDVGANIGLYTRTLARLSRHVHAVEPSYAMAEFLRRTSARNVTVHQVAASDHPGEARLLVPQGENGPVHGLATIEPSAQQPNLAETAVRVNTQRLDDLIRDDVAFVKIDVEGHELGVLRGAVGIIERSRPVFLVEAENRHRPDAIASVFRFFADRDYRGYFIKDGEVVSISEFDASLLQDRDALDANGGRRAGLHYINNFFFFPWHLDGPAILDRVS